MSWGKAPHRLTYHLDRFVPAQAESPIMNTLTLEHAATFLKMHPEEVRCRAKHGLIPASKPGRRWVFIDDDQQLSCGGFTLLGGKRCG